MHIRIAGREVGDGCPPYVVAEIGQNHQGDAYTAIRMVAMAVQCHADAVKFQLRDCTKEFASDVLNAPHPDPDKAFGATYREHRMTLDLSAMDLRHIRERIKYNEWPVAMFATPCDVSLVAPLVELDMPAYKVASKDLTNLPLVDAVAQTGKPVILSTGMASMTDVARAIDVVTDYTQDFVVMQCTSQYPCADENLHLRAMVKMREEFNCLVGLSDHTVGILAGPLAVSHGACMVEKHVTLARAQKGTDHAAAVEKDGLERLVRDCHNARLMMGASEKVCLAVAEPARDKMARTVAK